MIKLGSQEHKKLFCQSFIDSHIHYEPDKIPWPQLDGVALERLKSIPFWQEALYTERKAGVMVSAFAETIDDPIIKEVIALQGKEEARHGRLIEFLINHYQIEITDPEIPELPHNIETAFIDFGFGECLDSFFAFGMFGIARKAQYLPEPFFTIFDPILDEEARHIVFFVNWITYLQIQRGFSTNIERGIQALWHYIRAIQELTQAFGGGEDKEQKAFSATGAKSFMDDLTPELFFATCLEENANRMSVFNPQLLQPRLFPRISQVAYNCLKLLPKKQPTPTTQQS